MIKKIPEIFPLFFVTGRRYSGVLTQDRSNYYLFEVIISYRFELNAIYVINRTRRTLYAKSYELDNNLYKLS